MPLPLLGIATALAAEFAPTLIRKLAGDDAAAVAEQVVGIAQTVTGAPNGEAALENLRADPNAVLAFKTEMANLEVRLEEAFLADRQNARKRDVQMRRAGYHNWRADIMLGLAFASLCFIIYMINSQISVISGEVLAIFNMAIGALLKMLSDGFQFEFGSSRGSKEKDMRP